MYKPLRDKLIDFLVWNDGNGCFSDKDCIQEGYEPLNLVQAIKLLVKELIRSDDSFEYINVTKEFNKHSELKDIIHALKIGIPYKKIITEYIID